jgi:hypothetical protein
MDPCINSPYIHKGSTLINPKGSCPYIQTLNKKISDALLPCCTFENCFEKRQSAHYCCAHSCSIKTCNKPIKFIGYNFCVDHLCPECSDYKEKDKPACIEHTCCLCGGLKRRGSKFCDKHTIINIRDYKKNHKNSPSTHTSASESELSAPAQQLLKISAPAFVPAFVPESVTSVPAQQLLENPVELMLTSVQAPTQAQMNVRVQSVQVSVPMQAGSKGSIPFMHPLEQLLNSPYKPIHTEQTQNQQTQIFRKCKFMEQNGMICYNVTMNGDYCFAHSCPICFNVKNWWQTVCGGHLKDGNCQRLYQFGRCGRGTNDKFCCYHSCPKCGGEKGSLQDKCQKCYQNDCDNHF